VCDFSQTGAKREFEAGAKRSRDFASGLGGAQGKFGQAGTK